MPLPKENLNKYWASNGYGRQAGRRIARDSKHAIEQGRLEEILG